VTAINRTISINHRQQEIIDEIFSEEPYGLVQALTGEILAIDWVGYTMYEIAYDGRYDKLMVRNRL
jgi:hypothetical protein